MRSRMPIGRDRIVARSDNPFMSLQREIDRLADDFPRGFPVLSTGAAAELLPNVNVTETMTAVLLTRSLMPRRAVHSARLAVLSKQNRPI